MALTASTMIACGSDEYTVNNMTEKEKKNILERAREETEEEVAKRAKQQLDIAKAKAEVIKQQSDVELSEDGSKGEVGVSSSTRQGITIPTYLFFPEEYEAGKTYPLVIMFAGFASAHDNGTRFDDYVADMNKNGLIVVQYDVPGYGKSSEDNLDYTLTNIENDALDVLNYVKSNYNIGKVGAFGYDVGGRAIMEIQVDGLYDFDQIELIGPFCETKEFINACFGQKTWDELKGKAIQDKSVQFGKQVYSLQWFLDWEEKADTLTADFCKNYKNRRMMLIYSSIDDCISKYVMIDLYKRIGAAAVEISDWGHDLGVRGYDTPKQTTAVIREQSANFMKDLKDE